MSPMSHRLPDLSPSLLWRSSSVLCRHLCLRPTTKSYVGTSLWVFWMIACPKYASSLLLSVHCSFWGPRDQTHNHETPLTPSGHILSPSLVYRTPSILLSFIFSRTWLFRFQTGLKTVRPYCLCLFQSTVQLSFIESFCYVDISQYYWRRNSLTIEE